jgi:beta-barrel assembly-enhancing protease
MINKYVVTFFLMLSISFLTTAQSFNLDLKGIVNKNISSSLIKGKEVVLKSVGTITIDGKTKTNFLVVFDENVEFVEVNKLDQFTFNSLDQDQFWKLQMLKLGVYKNIKKNGYQYELRKELEVAALKYIKYAEDDNLIFKDSYLQSYLYSLAHKIHPKRIKDGRPGILNIKILKDSDPNSFIFSNGTMFLTTGLLSTINSEEELIGIMAHEISHYALDHTINNINKIERREKNAKIWSGVAMGLAAGVGAYASPTNKYLNAGIYAAGAGVLAYAFSSEFNKYMGLKYSIEQIVEADRCAVKLMKLIGVDPLALSSALTKIKKYCILDGNYLALMDTGAHPQIVDRVNQIGSPTKDYNNINYNKTISFVNSFNAIAQLNKQHIESCSSLINRNIDAGVATQDDYVLLAKATTFMFDNKEKNNEALGYINTAKELDISPSISLLKQEVILLIRLGSYTVAKDVLNKCLKVIKDEQLMLDKIKNPEYWSSLNNFLLREKSWTKNMINKVSTM